jgi:hypothetical protein
MSGRSRVPYGEKPHPYFDVVFGIVLPLLCLALDPIVFRSGEFGNAVLPRWRPAAYLFIASEIGLLVLGWRLRLRAGRAAFVGGALLVGGILSLGLGVALAPLSLVGIFLGVGLLGFTPLFTAFVYLRNAARAVRRAGPFRPRLGLAYAAGVAVAVVPALTVHGVGTRVMDSSIARLKAGDDAAVDDAAGRLRRWSLLVEADDLVEAFRRSRDDATRARIAEVYRRLTSGDIRSRMNEIMD